MVISGGSVHFTTFFPGQTWEYLVHIPVLLLVTDNNLCRGREENDRRNYFMINLHESMGPGRDRTRVLVLIALSSKEGCGKPV